MKFSLSREAILKPLQLVVGVVERRQTLPILSNVLLSLDGQRLSMTGTDLEVEDGLNAHGITTTTIVPTQYGNGGTRTAANFRFVVLRIPCQYGKMTDAALWD